MRLSDLLKDIFKTVHLMNWKNRGRPSGPEAGGFGTCCKQTRSPSLCLRMHPANPRATSACWRLQVPPTQLLGPALDTTAALHCLWTLPSRSLLGLVNSLGTAGPRQSPPSSMPLPVASLSVLGLSDCTSCASELLGAEATAGAPGLPTPQGHGQTQPGVNGAVGVLVFVKDGPLPRLPGTAGALSKAADGHILSPGLSG